MYSTFTTTSIVTSTICSSFVPQNPFFSSPKQRKFRTKKLPIKSSTKPSLNPLNVSSTQTPSIVRLLQCSKTSIKFSVVKQNEDKKKPSFCSDENNQKFTAFVKPLVYTLFCLALGSCPVFGIFYKPAVAVAAVAREVVKGESEKKGHEYSHCTESLLKTASLLVRAIEEARRGESDIEVVEQRLEEVKRRKRVLQGEIMNRLNEELRVLEAEKVGLAQRSEDVLDAVLKAKKKEKELVSQVTESAEEVKGKIGKLEEVVRDGEREYNEIWEKVSEIEDRITRRETLALRIGVRELMLIERECEQLVEGFVKEIRRQTFESVPKGVVSKLSKDQIQEELKTAKRKLMERIVLPNVVDNENIGPPFDQYSSNFAQRIKQVLRDSREMQRDLETRIRKNMKKHGDEKRFVVNTPLDEVVKGYPEVELKWMFGNKEVVVPKAVSLHLFHGWKKWREEHKADLKKNLLEDFELGKNYVTERQERILLDRDRVASKTWYDEEKSRWEMDPIAVPYAVSRKLIERARIRHDWGAMYLTLKGDEKEYYVDPKEVEMVFEEFGGFDGLYLRMLASGVPIAVQLMWIPFSELDFRQLCFLMMSICHQCFTGLWNTKGLADARKWTLREIRNINDDIMMMIVFPIVEFLIPHQVRIRLGMAWPVDIDQVVESTWYLKWQSEAEMNVRSRITEDFWWYLWFLIRTSIYGYVVFHVFRFLKGKIPRVLGYGPLRRDPNLGKWNRVKFYFKFRRSIILRMMKRGFDPISTAFDQMKRVKNPPIRLKDFASVESMREEINEVVAFLQNPRAFQEMGARAPRGVLIVGERGTGKTSLALAIAAEAKVPVVEVKGQQFETGLWVGQSASNIRELFQTARDLAPVIIFVEDFDAFTGIRGKYIHTVKQDHEAFINQLLVELDGFEKQDGVVLMATTQNLKKIDKALKRPGRMDRIFRLQQPTLSERERILQISAKETMDEELIDYVDWRKVAEKTALLRPVELKLVPVALEGSAFRSKFLDTDELQSYCKWFATFSGIFPNWVRKTKIGKKIGKAMVNHLGLTLTKEDLQNVVDLMEPYGQISNGVELLSPQLDWTRETKYPHAVWAAGRGLLALLIPNFDVVENLWLEPLSWEGIGCTKITKAKTEGFSNENVESRAYLEKKLVFCFGSHIAAQLLLPFGEENILSASELKQAQEIATRMVIRYGWGPDDSPTIYQHGNANVASMGNNYEYDMASKVEKMYYLAYEKAKMMLQKNQQVLEMIVEELLQYEILTGKDLEKIITDNGGIREREPFFLTNECDEEPLFRSLLENGNASMTSLLAAEN